MDEYGTPEDRLEAALERIAKAVDLSSIAVPSDAHANPAATDFADRLDRIIDTLREALGK